MSDSSLNAFWSNFLGESPKLVQANYHRIYCHQSNIVDGRGACRDWLGTYW
jgi:hypothetical protein